VGTDKIRSDKLSPFVAFFKGATKSYRKNLKKGQLVLFCRLFVAFLSFFLIFKVFSFKKSDKLPTKNRELEKGDRWRFLFCPVGAHPS